MSICVCLCIYLSVFVCLSASVYVCRLSANTGTYTCMATNVIGQSSNQANLNVEPSMADEPVDETSYVSPDTLRRLMLRWTRLQPGFRSNAIACVA